MKKRVRALMLFFICFNLSICLSLLSACNKAPVIEEKSVMNVNVYTTNYDFSAYDVEITGELSRFADESTAIEAIQANVDENKLLGWGISRRTQNQPPAADPGSPELLKTYGSVYIGDTSQKKIYLTFDEGYENGYTEKILDVLWENHVRAVFFITGPYLKEHQNLVRRMVEEGHIIGNHTVHHKSLPQISDAEIEDEILELDRAFCEKFGENMIFLRPPKGEYSRRSLSVTQRLGYVNMFWSFAYDDWHTDKNRGADYAHQMVMGNLHNGAVLLLHAVSKDNADALDRIIKDAIQEGYTFGNAYDLIAGPGSEVEDVSDESQS